MSDETKVVGSHEGAEVTEGEALEAQERAQRCYEEIGEVLKRHRCSLVSHIQPPDVVGSTGDCVQVRAVPVVVPYFDE